MQPALQLLPLPTLETFLIDLPRSLLGSFLRAPCELLGCCIIRWGLPSADRRHPCPAGWGGMDLWSTYLLASTHRPRSNHQMNYRGSGGVLLFQKQQLSSAVRLEQLCYLMMENLKNCLFHPASSTMKNSKPKCNHLHVKHFTKNPAVAEKADCTAPSWIAVECAVLKFHTRKVGKLTVSLKDDVTERRWVNNFTSLTIRYDVLISKTIGLYRYFDISSHHYIA